MKSYPFRTIPKRSFAVRNTLVVLLCGLVFVGRSLAAEGGGPLRLTLTPMINAVVGVPMSIYYDNIVLTETPERYQFEIHCDVGIREQRRWTVTPEAADVGEHRLTATVTDAAGKKLGTASTVLRVVAADAGSGRDVRLLIVGDSLTHGTLYPNEIARLLSTPGNPSWKMLGTHRPKSAAAGVAHEGYGGWTWQRFVAQYEPNPDGTYRKRSSPFVYLGKDGKPALDVKRYIEEECQGQPPTVVFFLLGINDCFSADPDDPAAIEIKIDTMIGHAETLLRAFRKAAPEADLAVGVTTPPNAREEAFEANYKNRYHRWGWKRIQHRLVERQLEHFAHRAKDKIFLVPTQLNLDPIDGYPANNGVHPNAAGYQQIGASFYAWLKVQLVAKSEER